MKKCGRKKGYSNDKINIFSFKSGVGEDWVQADRVNDFLVFCGADPKKFTKVGIIKTQV